LQKLIQSSYYLFITKNYTRLINIYRKLKKTIWIIVREKIDKNKWLFKQFTIINRTATSVYSAIQGGIDMNFYKCYTEYENGVFGWIKESRAFYTAIEIYDQYTSSDGWDIMNQLEDEFGDELVNMEYAEISKWENELIEQ